MAIRESTSGLSPEEIAGVLAVAGRDDVPEDLRPQQDTGDALRRLLNRGVLLDAEESHSFPAVLSRSCDEIRSCAGRSLADALSDARLRAAAGRTIKQYAKALLRRAESDADRAAATALYYGAIAAALVCRSCKVTRLSYPRLEEGLTKLEQKFWLPDELKDLCARAIRLCRLVNAGTAPRGD